MLGWLSKEAKARWEPALTPCPLSQRLGEGEAGPAAWSDPLAQLLGEGAGGEGLPGAWLGSLPCSASPALLRSKKSFGAEEEFEPRRAYRIKQGQWKSDAPRLCGPSE